MSQNQVFLAAALALAAQTVIAQGLPDETQTREAADAQLQGNINNEAAARSAADSQLQNNINAEAAARSAAITNLQNNVAAEAQARSNADTELDGRINVEAVTRMQAIQDLRELIGTGGGSGGGTANVDCDTGGKISQALATGAAQVIVRGSCNETVTISRDDVSLQGEAGATIQGPDPNLNVVTIRAHRVTVEGLTIRGGRNGITGIGASNLTVRNVVVQSVGRSGIAYAFGSSGTIAGCNVQSSGRDGIVLDGAYARIINCTLTGNARNGILVVNGGNSPMGFTDRFEEARNTIQNNGANGISITLGSVATVAASDILNNALFGVSVFHSTASVSGRNLIRDNANAGISVTASRVIVGDAGPGLPTTNEIRGNARLVPAGGVLANLGSSIFIRDAQIVGNGGPGISLQLRSQAQLTNSNIEGNARNGIEMVLGAALSPFASPAGTTVRGNTGLGLVCSDSESSVVMGGPSGPPFGLVFSGNTLGEFSCTSFDQQPAFPPPPPPGPLPGL